MATLNLFYNLFAIKDSFFLKNEFYDLGQKKRIFAPKKHTSHHSIFPPDA